MRLFTAIELPDDLKRRLAGVGREMIARHWGAEGAPVAVTHTPGRNLHVTLNFFGEVSQRDVPKLCDVLGRVSRGGAIPLDVQGIEFFPERGPVRVVAARVGGDTGRLVRVREGIDRACSDLGFPRDVRQYRPHVTLTRSSQGLPHLRNYWKGGAGTYPDSIVGRLANSSAFAAREFVLMESHLSSDVPAYTPVERFPLAL